MNRVRCSELLDLLLANRGFRCDAVHYFRVSLPYASGTQCRRALCQLHELLTGETIELAPIVFSRAKLDLRCCGIGVLEFHSNRLLDSTWTRFEPTDWRDKVVAFHQARQRTVPDSFHFKGSITVPATTEYFDPQEIVLLTTESKIGLPSGLQQDCNSIKGRVRTIYLSEVTEADRTKFEPTADPVAQA